MKDVCIHLAADLLFHHPFLKGRSYTRDDPSEGRRRSFTCKTRTARRIGTSIYRYVVRLISTCERNQRGFGSIGQEDEQKRARALHSSSHLSTLAYFKLLHRFP